MELIKSLKLSYFPTINDNKRSTNESIINFTSIANIIDHVFAKIPSMTNLLPSVYVFHICHFAAAQLLWKD